MDPACYDFFSLKLLETAAATAEELCLVGVLLILVL